MEIKFLKKGLKVNGKYYPCWYSSSSGNLGRWATVYLKTYERLPEGTYEELEIKNDTEIIEDYIEKDRIKITPSSKYFKLIESLAERK